jgi:hypothetical protein
LADSLHAKVNLTFITNSIAAKLGIQWPWIRPFTDLILTYSITTFNERTLKGRGIDWLAEHIPGRFQYRKSRLVLHHKTKPNVPSLLINHPKVLFRGRSNPLNCLRKIDFKYAAKFLEL